MNKNNMKVIAIIIVFLIAGFIGFLISNNKEQKKAANNTTTSNAINNSVTNNISNNTTNTVPTSTTKYTQEQLEKMALDYYELKNNYRPGSVSSEISSDGKLSIQLYDNMGDHNATSAWYTVDMNTAKGTDTLGNPVDLNDKTKPEDVNNISSIKTAFKNEEWLKQNVTMKKSCFGEDITSAVEWTFMNIVGTDYSPTVVVVANANSDTSIQAFVVTCQNGKVVSNPVQDNASHSGHVQILVDPNNAKVMLVYIHMGVNMTTVYDIKTGSANQVASFGKEEQYSPQANDIVTTYYKDGQTVISKEEYDQLSKQYDIITYHEVGTKITNSNVDRFIS